MRAKSLKTIDFAPLREMAIDYIRNMAKGVGHEDDDAPHYMYEELMEAVYGKKVWEYINNKGIL